MGLATAIGGAAILGGSIIGSKSQSKAASKAADTSLQVAQQNNALARDIYGQNKQALSPYMQRGNVAGDQINALLGLGGAGPTYAPAPQQNALYNAPVSEFGGLAGGIRGLPSTYFGAQAAQLGYNRAGDPFGGVVNTTSAQNPYQGQPVSGGVSPQQAANDAFDIFRNSTGYQFRLGEGMNALNSGYAGAGTLQSGDALKSALEYGQNFASNEFGNYMGYLSNQQGVGLSGASALAGVGQNYVNTVSANNQNAGDAQANAYLVKGANNPFANALGALGGGILGGL